MRLSAENLTLERGGRRLFAGLSFALGAGEALVVDGPERRRQVEPVARPRRAFCRSRPAASRLEGGEMRAEQTHYLGHADALKSALTAAENLALLGRPARRATRRASLRRWRGSACRMSPIFRCARCRRGRSGASRWRGCSSRRGRCGCSTSRRRRSTPARKACSPTSCASISPAAASSSRRPTRRSGSMRRAACGSKARAGSAA